MKLTRLFLTFTLLGVLAVAADAPVNLNDDAHKTARLELISSYQRALISQIQAQNSQASAAAAIKAYQSTAARIAEEEKLPKGTDFKVDIDNGTVTPIIPPPAPAKKEKSEEPPKKP